MPFWIHLMICVSHCNNPLKQKKWKFSKSRVAIHIGSGAQNNTHSYSSQQQQWCWWDWKWHWIWYHWQKAHDFAVKISGRNDKAWGFKCVQTGPRWQCQNVSWDNGQWQQWQCGSRKGWTVEGNRFATAWTAIVEWHSLFPGRCSMLQRPKVFPHQWEFFRKHSVPCHWTQWQQSSIHHEWMQSAKPFSTKWICFCTAFAGQLNSPNCQMHLLVLDHVLFLGTVFTGWHQSFEWHFFVLDIVEMRWKSFVENCLVLSCQSEPF